MFPMKKRSNGSGAPREDSSLAERLSAQNTAKVASEEGRMNGVVRPGRAPYSA